MIERKLVEVRPGLYGSRAFFTKAGIAALRQLAANHRYLNPTRFGHIERELAAMTAEVSEDNVSVK